LRGSIEFIDLQAQRRRLGDRVDKAIARVLEHGKFIMGPEVRELEEQLSEFSGASQVVSCASGTDALVLALMALGVGSGDAVLVPAFTFAATAEAVALLGAVPVFVDVLPDTFDLDVVSLASAVAVAKEGGLRPVGVIAVDLFGQPADYRAVEAALSGEGMWIIADAAQSFGAEAEGRRVGQLARVTTTSFFPAKPLGCYGDGGAVLTDDADLAATMRSLRVHGQGTDKYDNVRVGINGRLDTLQAAVLLEKLSIFDDELVARERIAAAYSGSLNDLVVVPVVAPGVKSAWAQYTVLVEDRDRLAGRLAERGIPTAVYYPRPLHLQTAYASYPIAQTGLPVSVALSGQVLSLPMHPYLSPADQERITSAVRLALS
jgi:dTDP-4-amino-4,6-dideoxygalactose transaminase